MTQLFDERKATRAIKFFEHLKHTKSPFFGLPFELLSWQHKIVWNVYGTVNERGLRVFQFVWIEVPKKNGKSEMGAGFALKHLFADGEQNGEVYGCAADKDQALLVFDVAVEMIGLVPELKKRAKLNLSTKLITDKKTGTFYKVVSSDAYTKHGLNVSAVVGDEIHAWPGRDMFDVMTKGAGETRLQPIWIFITTAGDDPDRVSIGWEQHAKAVTVLEARKTGQVEKDIPFWYPVIYSYPGEDIYNEENWALANPSLNETFSVERLRAAAQEAKQYKADERLFRWLRLNQWITTKLAGWLPIDLFDATVGEWKREELAGKICYLGLDLSTTTDLSALAAVFPPQEGFKDWRVIWECWIPGDNMQERVRVDHVPYDEWATGGWINVTEGKQIDYTLIKAKIQEFRELYKVKELDADKSFAVMLTQELEKERLTCVDIPQHYSDLTDPMQMIEVLLGKGQMTHEASPVARWCFGNTSISKNGNGQIKYVKEHKGKSLDRTKRIDLTAAWVIAMARAKFYKKAGGVYDRHGVRVVGGGKPALAAGTAAKP